MLPTTTDRVVCRLLLLLRQRLPTCPHSNPLSGARTLVVPPQRKMEGFIIPTDEHERACSEV